MFETNFEDSLRLRPSTRSGQFPSPSSISHVVPEVGFKSQCSPFFRVHIDPRNNTEVQTQTEAGLALYFEQRQRDEPALLNNAELIIDFDYEAGPNFSPEMQNRLRTTFAQNLNPSERRNYVIHRDGHTVSLMRQGDTFLVMDSYNAHGAKDNDLLPLLRIIRESNPNSRIVVLHDKMQNDYYNCRVFSVENLVESERFMQNNNLNLNQYIEHTRSECKELYPSELEREATYAEFGIETMPIPVPLITHAQSMSMIEKLSRPNDSKKDLLETERVEGLSYRKSLEINVEQGKREINRTIENSARLAERRLHKFNDVVNLPMPAIEGNNDHHVQKALVTKSFAQRELRRNSLTLKPIQYQTAIHN